MTLRLQQQQQPLFQQQQKQVHVVGASSAEFNSGSPLKSLPSSPQHSHLSSIPVELEEPYPLSLGCQRFFWISRVVRSTIRRKDTKSVY